MRKLLLAIALAVALCFSANARAQETGLLADIELAVEPAADLGDLLKEASKWIIEHGEIAYLYDCVDGEKGSETIAKLTLFDIADVVNVDIGATIPLENPDEAPALVAGLGISLSTVLDKCGVEWDLKFDISAGILAGYDFGDHDWMVGPTIGVSGEF